MRIINNKPVDISPMIDTYVDNDLNVFDYVKNICQQMTTPINSSQNVAIVDDDGNTCNIDDLISLCVKCLDANIDGDDQKSMHHVLSQAMLHYHHDPFLVNHLFVAQASSQLQSPLAKSNVIYTVKGDVIPAAKSWIAGSDDKELFLAIANYAKPNCLGIGCKTRSDFIRFRDNVHQRMLQFSQNLSPSTLSMIGEFSRIDLADLTESLLLRNDDGDCNEPYSFARLLHHCCMDELKNNPCDEIALMPFAVNELLNPRSIVFINADAHMRRSITAIKREWSIINKSIASPYNKVLSLDKLTKLTSVTRSINTTIDAYRDFSSRVAKENEKVRGDHVPLGTKPLSSVDIYRRVCKISKKMSHVMRSHNSYKSVKMSFLKPNRRNPDDFNRQGKLVSTKYRPDIHLFVDTSGSISEEDYRHAMTSCIVLAKKLNVNLYFSSFSHYLSQAVLLPTKDRSVRQIYQQVQKIPKAYGGTDFQNVWEYIQRNTERRRRLSLIITDFGYSAPNEHFDHPTNLYYIPCSFANFSYIRNSAQFFMESMKITMPHIRRHILF